MLHGRNGLGIKGILKLKTQNTLASIDRAKTMFTYVFKEKRITFFLRGLFITELSEIIFLEIPVLFELPSSFELLHIDLRTFL